MDYTVIRSKRKTIQMEVRPDLSVLVRVPKKMTEQEIQDFVLSHRNWLKKAILRTEERNRNFAQWESPEQQQILQKAAEEYLPKRTAHWAELMGLFPTGIRITDATTRFGSCSAKNRICYSRRLMIYPKPAIDYVIVHELAHIKQKNHSSDFYSLVARYLPDWKERRELLKK